MIANMSKASALVEVSKKRVNPFKELWTNKFLYLLALPAVVYTFIFSYLTLPYIVIAFEKFNYKTGVFSPFVGLKNFEYFFKSSWAWTVTRNTLVINILFLIVGTVCSVVLAIVLNEVKAKKFLKVSQSMMLFPYFISWVIASNIFLTFLSGDGLINKILLALHVTDEPILFFQKGPYFWWIIALANTWKNMGYNAIIYLAAISGIDAELYEAAEVDGANRLQRIWNITLPALRPQIGILLILAIGGILNTGFEQQLLMGNNAILNYSDVLDTYAYRYGMKNGMYSYGTAVGLFKSAVSFILVLAANKITAKLNDSALF